MVNIFVVTTVLLNIRLSVGQISGSTKCTSSSLTSCTFNQIRCPVNYYFNGQFCLPIQENKPLPIHVNRTSVTPPETKCVVPPSATISPTVPDPLPIKPVCQPFYQWNGNECYMILSNNPICPEGHNLTSNGQCVSQLPVICQENYYRNGDSCVGLLEAPVDCPPDYFWDGSICIYRIMPTCPEGFELRNGNCEKFVTGSCSKGTIMDNFKCIGHHQVEIQCDDGYYFDGNYCVNSTKSCEDGYQLVDNVCQYVITTSPDFECPPRTEMIGQKCMSIEKICPKGYALIDSLCVKQNKASNLTVSIPSNCTVGYQLVGCECVKKNAINYPIRYELQCPPNYTLKDGFCYYEQDQRHTICPSNYSLINGICVQTVQEICQEGQKLINGVCVIIDGFVETPTNCSDGNTLIYGKCTNLIKCPQVECQSNCTSNCNCPAGYAFINGTCILTQYTPVTVLSDDSPCPSDYKWINETCIHVYTESVICPPGYWRIDKNCVKEAPPAYKICPPGHLWINETCIQTVHSVSNVCLPGFQWVAGNCMLRENAPCPSIYQLINGTCADTDHSGYKKCSPGFQWINGTCSRCMTYVSSNCEDRNNTTNQQDLPSILPLVVQPCYSSTQVPPCKPCQLCPTHNDFNHQPPAGPPMLPTSPDCANCPQVTKTKDGHISITNIVNIAQRLQSNQKNIITDHDDHNYDDFKATEDTENSKKCCEIITPRQCKQNRDEWTCFHRKYQRCGDVCTQPKIYLKPRIIHYEPPILVMPPPPRRNFGRRRMFSLGAIDCSGCIHGGYRCSFECYSYPDCNWSDSSDCSFIDQHNYCEEWKNNNIEGCTTEDGYYE